jgi:tetratricopeptide (TPR) repeat protein
MKCNWDLIARYALRELSQTEEKRAEDHLLACPSCALRVVKLGDRKRKRQLPNGPTTPDETIRIIRVLADRMEREQVGVDELVDELLRSAPARWHYIVSLDQRFQTAAVGGAILNRAEQAFYSQPSRARELAELAIDITRALKDTEERDRLEALAYRKLSSAYVGLGEHAEALGALYNAESAIGPWPDADLQNAILGYARANVLQVMGRSAEAIQLIEDAIEVFRTWGDTKHVIDARMVLALIDYRAGRFLPRASSLSN